jgi:hypothetical protein
MTEKNSDGTIKIYARPEISTTAKTFVVANKQDRVSKALELTMSSILAAAQTGKFSCDSPFFKAENSDVMEVIGTSLQELGYNVKVEKDGSATKLVVSWGIYK